MRCSPSLLLQAIRYAARSPAHPGLIDSLQRQSRATIACKSGVTLEQAVTSGQNPCAWGSLSSPPRSLIPFLPSFLPSSSVLALQQQVRGLNTSSPFQQQSVSVELASNVLEQSNVLALREELELLSKGTNVISFSDFARLASSTGCSRTGEEAAALCAHLQKACVVLRHQDSVYLRPEEIAEAVMMMMPRNKQDAEQRLSQVEAELKDLENVHSQLEQAAQRRTNFMLSLGLVVLVTQFIAFFYLTWWELSWDVMEPIGEYEQWLWDVPLSRVQCSGLTGGLFFLTSGFKAHNYGRRHASRVPWKCCASFCCRECLGGQDHYCSSNADSGVGCT
ncbi:hypothetical protein DUNSADRAFT_8766 [Dunaliella salina]|uniref:Calcium uniporter protein C-terminal domain-containing protein n=1 Tax=Dunaliella salina TaxID=3046 RepID=A0ABQ7GIR5_DUNSA|nr:hypothetical protein DUNSADRAFT_8766 [Dunaliella salina]|eukprot:KAF5834515.1 hypothetical protein DUNSADRAFT_8766 [Dunaliella salina]